MNKIFLCTFVFATLALGDCIYFGGGNLRASTINIGSAKASIGFTKGGSASNGPVVVQLVFGQGSTLKITLNGDASSTRKWTVIYGQDNILQMSHFHERRN